MKCREFVEFLMRYLDGDLTETESSVFEKHMADCPPCGQYLRSYEKTIQLGFSVCREGGDDLPEDIPEDLVKAVLEARKAN